MMKLQLNLQMVSATDPGVYLLPYLLDIASAAFAAIEY